MGLSATIKKAVASAFKVIDDIPADCSITRTTEQTYDPVTDTYSGGTAIAYPFQGIITNYNLNLINGTVIQQGDVMITSRQAEMIIEPANGETIVIDSVNWQIISYNQDTLLPEYHHQIA